MKMARLFFFFFGTVFRCDGAVMLEKGMLRYDNVKCIEKNKYAPF